MNKRDYFIAAMRAETWRHRVWLFSAFNVTNLNSQPHPEDLWSYRLFEQDGKFVFVDPTQNNQLTLIEEGSTDEPLFGIKETFILRAGEFPNASADIKTTYGNALFNAIAFVSPFGAKVPYLNRAVKARAIEAQFVERIVDNPKPGEQVDPTKVTVSEVHKHLAAMHDVVQNLDKLCVQSSSPLQLGIDPSVLELRDRLLAEHKDQLNDLAVVANIVKQLVEADKATFKGDPAEGFFIKDKQFNVARFRTKIMHGIEYSFAGDGTFDLVTKSLSEGWDFTKFPTLNNSLRDGSYSRGAKTALGGEAVKFFYRRYQNSRYVEGDCGTPVTIPRAITSSNAKRVVGNSYVNSKGELLKITPENYQSLIGTTVSMRDPAGCRAGGFDYCMTCFGSSLENAPEMIANVTAQVASQFMDIFMAKMHGTTLRTTRVNFKTWIK